MAGRAGDGPMSRVRYTWHTAVWSWHEVLTKGAIADMQRLPVTYVVSVQSSCLDMPRH